MLRDILSKFLFSTAGSVSTESKYTLFGPRIELTITIYSCNPLDYFLSRKLGALNISCLLVISIAYHVWLNSLKLHFCHSHCCCCFWRPSFICLYHFIKVSNIVLISTLGLLRRSTLPGPCSGSFFQMSNSPVLFLVSYFHFISQVIITKFIFYTWLAMFDFNVLSLTTAFPLFFLQSYF